MTKPDAIIKVLVIDDDKQMCRVFERVFTQAQFDLTIANAVEIAIALIGAHSFDVIVCDVRMPKMSGMDLLRALHSHGGDVPVILVTGDASPAIREEARLLGVFDCLSKPFEHSVLLSAVEQAAKLRSTRRTLV